MKTLGRALSMSVLAISVACSNADVDSVAQRHSEEPHADAHKRADRLDPLAPDRAERVMFAIKSLSDDDPQRVQDSVDYLLFEVGLEAVPIIIANLDDYRRMIHGFRIKNPSGYWETYGLYGPDKVLDCLTLVLTYQTGESFGTILGPVPDEKRRLVVSAWRAWQRAERGDRSAELELQQLRVLLIPFDDIQVEIDYLLRVDK